jgi:methionyl-tRNA formyltransferase
MTRPMRIAFFAPEEPTQLPPLFGRLLPALAHDDLTMVIVRPVYKGSSLRREALRFGRAFGWRELTIESASVLRHRAADVANRTAGVGSFHSVAAAAAAHQVPTLRPGDINEPSFVARIAALEPDLLVSVSCPQIFGRALLDVPSIACLNLHSALLPQYRGVLPTFWAMANGEDETGVTLYVMSEGIDDGEIVSQRRIPIEPGTTLRSLMTACKTAGGELILQAIDDLREGSLVTSSPATTGASYYSFPGRSDVQRFRAHGWRLR